LYLKDGRIVNIISDRGKYNKITHDCFFEENVKATDGETKIFAENLDLLATENFIKVYNNVKLNHPMGLIIADKIDYNFETKNFKISMFDDKAVKMKVIQ
jgi:lipopolysaccharide assembly outer membrane protein LptD (OstA)